MALVIEERPKISPVWNGYPILTRYPYAMPGEALATVNGVEAELLGPPIETVPAAGEVTLAAYAHAEERPFEIQELQIDVTGIFILAGNNPVDPVVSQSTYLDGINLLDAEITLNVVRDQDASQSWLRNPTRVPLAFNPETGAWLLTKPVVVEQGQGVMITVQAAGTTFNVTVDGNPIAVSIDRVAITLLGELLELGQRS